MSQTFIEQVTHHLFGVLMPVAGGLLLYWLIGRILDVLVKGSALPRLALRPTTVVVRYTILGGVLFMVFAHFEIPVEGFWTILSTIIAAIAVAFVAFWSALSNLLCTFLLIMLKMFSMGDHIELPPDSLGGEVVDLTLFFTVLRDKEGYLIHVPNSLFFQRMIKHRKGGGSSAIGASKPPGNPPGKQLPEIPLQPGAR